MEINGLPEMPSEETGYLIADDGTTYKISTDTLKGTVVNNLTETTTGKILDARQGRILNNDNTDNVAALISLNAIIDADISADKSMQAFRLPGTDTDNKIPSNASDMLLMVTQTANDYNRTTTVYTKLYTPAFGTEKDVTLGGYVNGSSYYRFTVKANPGGTNSVVTSDTSYEGTIDTSDLNLFRIYDPNAEL